MTRSSAETRKNTSDQDIAWIIWEAHRAYQMVLNDSLPAPPWPTIGPDLEYRRQMVVRMVELIREGVSGEDLHEEWCEAMISAGWVYGEDKDPTKKTHPCLVPWEFLPKEAKEKVYIAIGIAEAFM